jgi:hypothetical protein
MAILFFENKFYPKVKQGPEYTQELSFSHKNAVAFAYNGFFFAESLNNGGTSYHYKPDFREKITLQQWVLKAFGDNDSITSAYIPGTFYKRIWRPGLTHAPVQTYEPINQSFVALRILLNRLQGIFETVEPNNDNRNKYGHKIRELLLLACMEVESSWSAVLKENHYRKGRWTTKDYFKLKRAMFLDGYKVSLTQYHSYLPFSPFQNWDVSATTTSLSWYDAYNKTKHDREGNLQQATLEHAITAVGAVVVLFFAQFGRNFGGTGGDPFVPIIRHVFWHSEDFSGYDKEFYLPARVPGGSYHPWKEIDYPFF